MALGFTPVILFGDLGILRAGGERGNCALRVLMVLGSNTSPLTF